jgi:hypothetical protein
VGVVAVEVDGVAPVGVDAELVEVASASSALFSTPTPMLLEELLEPQPAMRIAAANAARPRVVRERTAWKSLRFLMGGQTNGTRLTRARLACAASVRIGRGPC